MVPHLYDREQRYGLRLFLQPPPPEFFERLDSRPVHESEESDRRKEAVIVIQM
jgi:hypothetical protein